MAKPNLPNLLKGRRYRKFVKRTCCPTLWGDGHRQAVWPCNKEHFPAQRLVCPKEGADCPLSSLACARHYQACGSNVQSLQENKSTPAGMPPSPLGGIGLTKKSVPLSMAMQLACGPWKYIRFLSVGNRQPHSVGPQVRKANLTSLAIYGTVLTVLIVIVQLVPRLKGCGAKQPHLIAE